MNIFDFAKKIYKRFSPIDPPIVDDVPIIGEEIDIGDDNFQPPKPVNPTPVPVKPHPIPVPKPIKPKEEDK